MEIKYGPGTAKYGPGVSIELTGDEVATAIDAWLVAVGVCVRGARTIRVNGELCDDGRVYVDPSGFVVANGERISGRGPDIEIVEVLRPRHRAYCVEGENRCVCGGDLPRVRAGCGNWRTE
jgi:hypothetical protein